MSKRITKHDLDEYFEHLSVSQAIDIANHVDRHISKVIHKNNDI